MNDLTTRDGRSLTVLASDANEHHRAAEDAARSALMHAREAGEALNEAKARVEHGEWTPWIREHFEATPQTARTYMRIARRWEDLQPHLENENALSIRGAVRALSGDTEGGGEEEDEESWLVPRGVEAILTTPQGFDELARVRPAKTDGYFWVLVFGEASMSHNWKPIRGPFVDRQLEACGFPVRYADVKVLGTVEGGARRNWNDLAFDTRDDHLHAWRKSWTEEAPDG